MTNPFSENELVEKEVIKIIKNLWNNEECFVNAYNEEGDKILGRENRSEVVLAKYLRQSIRKLNTNINKRAGLSEDDIDNVIKEIILNRDIKDLLEANKEIYNLLRNGVNIKIKDEQGESIQENIKIFDFENIENNDFLLVSQMWITGRVYTKRPDLIIFVNGIPLINIELKSIEKTLQDALDDNVIPYRNSIPNLYQYNMGIIISNGIESKFGSYTSDISYYNEWKKKESEDEIAQSDLETIIVGICDKKRLLDIFENFILFENKNKVVPRYFQYYGVNKAFENIINKKENKGKLGVFWHTQGSGKSYSMIFLSEKVLRKLNGNWTFVFVTDRSDLDRQIAGEFVKVTNGRKIEIKKAESIENLHNILGENHRQIFTTIQKFQNITETISDREDIIVVTDEAHRTQYSTFAQNMRKALPNASFIGFTGTPLIGEDKQKTKEVFGDYVSKYNFSDSIKDKATVPIFYGNRIVSLKLNNPEIENNLEQIIDRYDLEEEEQEKLENDFSQFYHIITREDRLQTVARDIVEHFFNRGFMGKAMVVSIDKPTSIRTYFKFNEEKDKYIKKLKLELDKESDEYKKLELENKIKEIENIESSIVISQSMDEVEKMKKWNIDIDPLREIMNKKDKEGNFILEKRFKDDNDNFKIVFVCGMWMTGFNVKSLSTLYLDKPMKSHTLMQAIARANRVYRDKESGLVVDYIGIFTKLKKALAIYASENENEVIIKDEEEKINILNENLNNIEIFLKGLNIDINQIIENIKIDNKQEITLLIEKFVNLILERNGDKENNNKKIFLKLADQTNQSYLSLLPNPKAEDYKIKVKAIKAISGRIRMKNKYDLSAVKKEMEELLDKSIQAEDYYLPEYKKLIDLSEMDADKLYEYFFNKENPNTNIKVDNMIEDLKEKIESLVRKNPQRKSFLERLEKLIREYNNGSKDIEDIVEELVNLSKTLNEEEERNIKENLTEEELAIFDILKKDSLTEDERDIVKDVAKELLQKIKLELGVQKDLKEFIPIKAFIKSEIKTFLYKLPETYTDEEVEERRQPVYDYVYQVF